MMLVTGRYRQFVGGGILTINGTGGGAVRAQFPSRKITSPNYHQQVKDL